MGTGFVYGSVTTGAGGTVTTSGGAVGDVSWITNGNTGIQSGWTNNTMNVAYPTNTAPSVTYSAWPTGSALSNVTSGIYSTASFTSSDSAHPMIITGIVTQYVTGTFTISGSGFVKIAPGASLYLVVGGKVTVSGGGVANATGLASNFSLIGLSTCNTITYSGSADFIGTVNAPQAALTISGSAAAYGAVIVNTAVLSGSGGFHYDAALAAGGGLIVNSWTEIPNP